MPRSNSYRRTRRMHTLTSGGAALAALIVVGCGGLAGGPDGPGPDLARSVDSTAQARSGELTRQIEQAEALWAGQAIDSYFIEVVHVQGTGQAQWQQVIVRDGAVAAAEGSCIPAAFEGRECEVQPFQAEDYSVPGLFAQARTAANGDQARWVTITFDPTYGFPASIDYDDPQIEDDDWALTVETFTALE